MWLGCLEEGQRLPVGGPAGSMSTWVDYWDLFTKQGQEFFSCLEPTHRAGDKLEEYREIHLVWFNHI